MDGTEVSLNTRFLSSGEVTAAVPAHLLRNPVIVQISVVTGDPMGWSDGVRSYPRSNAVNCAVVNSSTAGLAYAATFTASASCASELPAPARKRTYTATVFPDGNIQWTGPTVTPPTGDATISSGTFTGCEFSFSIDADRDPQSDAFHGIWDDWAEP